MKTPSLLFSLPLLATVLAAQTPAESSPSIAPDSTLSTERGIGTSLIGSKPVGKDSTGEAATSAEPNPTKGALPSSPETSQAPMAESLPPQLTVPASLAEAPCDTRTLRIRGQLRKLDILTDRVHVRPQHAKNYVLEVPGMASLHHTDLESTRLDKLGVDRVDLIAYPHGRPRTEAHKLLLTRRVCVKLAEGVSPSAFARSAGALLAERPHYAEEALVLTYSTALEAIDAAERLRSTPGSLGAYVIVASQRFPEMVPGQVQFFSGGGPEYAPRPQTDNVDGWTPPPFLVDILGTSAYQWWANNIPSIPVPPPLVPVLTEPFGGFLLLGRPRNSVPCRVDLNDFPPIAYNSTLTPKFQGEMADLRLPLAWEHIGDFNEPISGRMRKVLIIDDGVQRSHGDLLGAVDTNNSRHYNYFNQTHSPDPVNAATDSHGTSLAGIVGARIKAVGSRIAGVAPKCTFHSAVALQGFVDDFDWADAFAYSEPITIKDTDEDGDFLDEDRTGFLFFEVCLNAHSSSASGDALDLYPEDWLWKRAIRFGATKGRALKGVPYVTSAGNGGTGHNNVNYHEQKNSIYQIPVGAISDLGRGLAFSNPGAAVVCVGVSGIDELPPQMNWSVRPPANLFPPNRPIRKNHPISPDDIVQRYRRESSGVPTIRTNNGVDFNVNGTSPAAAEVAGVVALMLEANPELQARDIKEILLRCSRTCNDVRVDVNRDILPDDFITVTIGGYAYRLKTGAQWRMSPLGKPVHPVYGAGLVDADKAIKIAKKWTNLPVNPLPPIRRDVTADTFGNSVAIRNTETGGLYFPVMTGQLIPDDENRPLEIIVPGPPAGMRVEHIEVRVRLYHKRRGDLEVKLIAPPQVGWDGRELESELFAQHRDDYNESRYHISEVALRDPTDWTFSTIRHWGTIVEANSGGTWKITIRDATKQGTTTTPNISDPVYVPIANPTDLQSQRLEGVGITYHGCYTKGIYNSPPVVDGGAIRLGPGTQPVVSRLKVQELGRDPATGEVIFPVTSWDFWNNTVVRDDGIVVPVYSPLQPTNPPVDYFEFFPPQARDALDPEVLLPLSTLTFPDPVPVQPESPMWISYQLDPALRPATWPPAPTEGPVGGLFQFQKGVELTQDELWMVVRNPDNTNANTNFILVKLHRGTGDLEVVPVNSGRYAVNVYAGNMLGLSKPKTIDILVTRPGYNEWAALYFDPPQLADPAISGWLADLDGDGIRNGLEYSLRLNPTQPDPGPIPAYRIEGDEVVFSYTHDTTASQALLHAQISEDLGTWADVTPEMIGGANGLIDYEYRLPLVGDPRLFFRLWADDITTDQY
jgi:hypothetical protein